jgi:hypothetical protein
MTKKKNGGTKAENVVKAKGKGQAKAGAKLPANYAARFKGDFSDKAAIRARAGHTRLLALKTYGALKALIAERLAKGDSLETIGKSLQVSGARISEFYVLLGIERPKRGKPDKPKGKPKAMAADQGAEGDAS